MKKLLAVVEGDGDERAVPRLLSRALARSERYEWTVDEKRSFAVGGLGAFRKRIDSYVGLLRTQPVDAVLVLLDLEDACPRNEALALADDLRTAGLPFPVAVVFAYREYESWFLANLPSIAAESADLPDDAHYPGEPERPRDCEAPLRALMPDGRKYEPVLHQAAFTSALDFVAASERSRSFRRLLHAVEELTAAEGPIVTP